MNTRILGICVLILALTTMTTAQISPELEERLDQKPDTDRVEVIILTQSNASEQALRAVRNNNGNVSHEFNIIDGVAVEIPVVAADNLAQRDFVREIQPDYKVETIVSDSTGTINADEVWSNSTGEGTDVAILDTGIEDNTILNVEEEVDYTGEGTDDMNGHGTHVAGIVASPDEEYKGVAYNADLFDVKVLDQEGSGSASDVISGLEWAVDNQVEIATLSLGATVEECDGTSSLSEAVENTVENGVTVTVAAGNKGPGSETITAPGCAEKAITVGSSNDGEISDFSSRGPTSDGRVKPDLVAPGESITSLWKNDGDAPQFNTISGTSMSTPHVAGVAALLLSEQDLSPTEIKNITTSTAEDLGFDENKQGSGRVNANAAYQQIAESEKIENETENQTPEIEVLPTKIEFLNSSANAELRINATDTDNETLNATFYFEGEQISQKEGYGEIAHTETNLSLNTTYTWSAEATDGVNTTKTEELQFDTYNETEEENETNESIGELPEEAAERAREARRNRGGLFGPSSRLYGLDLAFDRAAVAVGLRSKQSVMEERAKEARQASEIGDNESAERAVRELRRFSGDGQNATREAEKTLNRVMKDAPEEAKQGLQNALRNAERQRQRGDQEEDNDSVSNNSENEDPVPDQGRDQQSNEDSGEDEQRPNQNPEDKLDQNQGSNNASPSTPQNQETGNSTLDDNIDQGETPGEQQDKGQTQSQEPEDVEESEEEPETNRGQKNENPSSNTPSNTDNRRSMVTERSE